MDDISNYWTEWKNKFGGDQVNHNRTLKDIVNSLLSKNVIVEDKKYGWLKHLPE